MQFDIDLPGHSPSRVQCEQIRTVDKCRLRERIYTLTGEELRKLDDCLAVSFGMTRQAAQEAAHSAAEAQDDIFHELTRNGLSVAVCPLPVLNQVNITITDGKTVSDKDGNKRTRFEVVADEVEFAESRRAAEDRPAGSLAAGYMENEGFAEIDGEDGELPF